MCLRDRVEDALLNNPDIETSSEVEENDKRRMLVKDTDIGKRLIGEKMCIRDRI